MSYDTFVIGMIFLWVSSAIFWVDEKKEKDR